MATKNSLYSLFSNAPSRQEKWRAEDEIFLIEKIPPEWFPLRTRKIWWCAHYSLKAVIEWKKWFKKSIEDYSSDWRSRATYLMTPWWIKKVLKKYNLNYSVIQARWLKKSDKLEILKENLKNWPIILLIANWQTKKKWFSRGKALTHRHYVTLRWYNDKKWFFYVYDSNTQRKTENWTMRWTLKVPYEYILKEWNLWVTRIIYSSYAIAVKY